MLSLVRPLWPAAASSACVERPGRPGMADRIFGPQAADVLHHVEEVVLDDIDGLEWMAARGIHFAEQGAYSSERAIERGVDTVYAAGAADVRSGGEILSRMFGAVVVVACFVVSYLTLRTHARNFAAPLLQSCVVRIVLLAPVCAALALLTLLIGGNVGVIFDMGRASYEGFCIYSFLALLLVYVGGPRKCAAVLSKDDCQYPGLSFSLCPLCKVRSARAPARRPGRDARRSSGP